MSEAVDPIAEAVASMEAVQPSGDPQAVETAEPQADQTPAPPASAEELPDDPTDAPETPSRGEKRVQQLLAERHQLRERLAYLEGIAQRGQQPATEQANQPKAPPLPQDLAQWVGDEPKPETFPAGEFDPQYLRAIARYEARSEQAQAVVMQRVHAARANEAQRAQAFFEKAAEAEKNHADFREVVGGLGQSLAAWQANMLAEAGPEVAYAFGKDAEAAARVRAARNPTAVALEIGRAMERLAASKVPPAPTPQPSAAPPPPPKVVRGSAAPAGFDWASADVEAIQKRLNGA